MAVIAPVGPDRTAVIPQEGQRNYAEVGSLGLQLSRRLGLPVLAHEVSDSDVVLLHVFRQGKRVHRYVSDLGMLADPVETDEGMMFEVDGVRYSEEALPQGPVGDDPAAIEPFGVGTVDLRWLANALYGREGEGTRIFAEQLHMEIIEALNLKPDLLTRAFRHTDVSDLANAELIDQAG